MKLRPYQQEAVAAIKKYFKETGYDICLEAPTGSGKSIIIAQLIKELLQKNRSLKILVLAHVKELVQQNYDKTKLIDNSLKTGIYCAGLNKKDTGCNIIFATINSIWKDLKRGLTKSGLNRINLIIIDEAHKVNVLNAGMYRKLIAAYKDNCNARVLGLTATPFRTKQGRIVGDNNIFDKMCYKIKIPNLIKSGYISKPITCGTKNHANFKHINIKNGEIDAVESARAMSLIANDSINEIKNKITQYSCKHIICFCSTINHATLVCEKLNNIGIKSNVLHSKKNKSRKKTIENFKSKKLTCLVNVNILTEGFDAPFIDCVILMRATMSPGLYIQMIGRGFRITPEKKQFLVLDFGENIERHGCVDDILTTPTQTKKTGVAPIKICPNCQLAQHLSSKKCIQCDHEFKAKEKLSQCASSNSILKSELKPTKLKVNNVLYSIHNKQDRPPSIKVQYFTDMATSFNEYICLFHSGFAQEKARKWWEKRCNFDIPTCVTNAIKLMQAFEIPTHITIMKNGKYWNIIDHEFKSQKLKFDLPIANLEEDIPF